VPGISGATILADGRAVLILDLAELAQDAARRALRTAVGGAEPVAPVATTRGLIMVVDDSLTIRRVTERLLVRQGYTVVTAKDGLDAMAQLQSETPLAILLDIEMPRADGFEVAAYVRNTARIATTPIIMITSRSGEKHRERARSLGVNRYLIKPYQDDQLLTELRGVLQES
jgi:chemosensory pili system protein ChpA (sensor histidine kinase/response regulator)